MRSIGIWSAPAERSGDGALDRLECGTTEFFERFLRFGQGIESKRRRRSALPAHSKLSRRHRRLNPARRFDEAFTPQFKRQQGPEQFAMIRNAAFMLVQ